jgi:Ni,Fe-hydrogenase I cytochrome b subunit
MKSQCEGDRAMANTDSEKYTPFQVWDAPTRWFHWINALAVFGLIVVGLGLLYDDALGLSASGKVLLKQVQFRSAMS